MKKRKTLKEVYSQHKKAIQIVILAIILAIPPFIVGYLVSWNFMWKPLNNTQFELCEQVARDVHAQKGNVIVEKPKDFSVSMTKTAIIVQPDNILYRGKVIAKLQNGELVITRDMETGVAILSSILVGMAFVTAEFLIAVEIYEKIKKESEK